VVPKALLVAGAPKALFVVAAPKALPPAGAPKALPVLVAVPKVVPKPRPPPAGAVDVPPKLKALIFQTFRF